MSNHLQHHHHHETHERHDNKSQASEVMHELAGSLWTKENMALIKREIEQRDKDRILGRAFGGGGGSHYFPDATTLIDGIMEGQNAIKHDLAGHKFI